MKKTLLSEGVGICFYLTAAVRTSLVNYISLLVDYINMAQIQVLELT